MNVFICLRQKSFATDCTDFHGLKYKAFHPRNSQTNRICCYKGWIKNIYYEPQVSFAAGKINAALTSL
jgi:hypothetical protein